MMIITLLPEIPQQEPSSTYKMITSSTTSCCNSTSLGRLLLYLPTQ